MKVIENQCVDCGLPCIGSACRYKDVEVYYCDNCEDEYAEYMLDDEYYCTDCAEKYLSSMFEDLTIFEQAEALNINIEGVDA